MQEMHGLGQSKVQWMITSRLLFCPVLVGVGVLMLRYPLHDCGTNNMQNCDGHM